jgi:ATP synthase protein I
MRQDGLYQMRFNYKKNRPWIENLSIITQLGLTMVGCILFCFFIGRYLDKFLGTKGIFVAVFTLLGVIGGGVVVYRQILEITEQKEEDNHSDNGID